MFSLLTLTIFLYYYWCRRAFSTASWIFTCITAIIFYSMFTIFTILSIVTMSTSISMVTMFTSVAMVTIFISVSMVSLCCSFSGESSLLVPTSQGEPLALLLQCSELKVPRPAPYTPFYSDVTDRNSIIMSVLTTLTLVRSLHLCGNVVCVQLLVIQRRFSLFYMTTLAMGGIYNHRSTEIVLNLLILRSLYICISNLLGFSCAGLCATPGS